MIPPRTLSFLVGFLSLGAETLWIRTYSFANESMPQALAIVLGIYLIGIARGAAMGGDKCKNGSDIASIAIWSILAASLVLVVSPLVIAALPRSNIVLIVLVYLPAMLYSICFPICHHLGTKAGDGRTGRSLSRVYAANIAGSVTGPLVVNFGLLEVATTQTAFVLLGTAGTLLATVLAFSTISPLLLVRASFAGILLAAAGVWWSAGAGNNLIARLALSPEPIRHIVETRQGIVVAHADDANGDVIYGGNVYDGRTNVNPRKDSNGLNRIIVLAALAPKPKRVLTIGLSVGSWQHLIAGFPGVESMDVVEINPGYLQLISNYDTQRRSIEDPRVRLIIGDGRKFLRQNPDLRYDLVVMNTTLHWRMYASLLLSKEYLSLVKSHMTDDAIMTFNTTSSGDALMTAANVFPHAYLYDNFAVVGRTDWRPRLATQEAAAALAQIKPAGRPLFGPGDAGVIADILNAGHVTDVETVARKMQRPLEVVTDRNLITEYRYGRYAVK